MNDKNNVGYIEQEHPLWYHPHNLRHRHHHLMGEDFDVDIIIILFQQQQRRTVVHIINNIIIIMLTTAATASINSFQNHTLVYYY